MVVPPEARFKPFFFSALCFSFLSHPNFGDIFVKSALQFALSVMYSI